MSSKFSAINATMKKYPTILLFVLILFGQAARPQIAKGLYGLKKLKNVDTATILEYAKKYHIPREADFTLDTAYLKFLSSFDSSIYKEQVKNHYQPLQALYYNRKGQLVSFQVNCYAGGFPNLDWNRNGNMTIFPPKQQAPLDKIMPLDTLREYLEPLSQSKINSNRNDDYTVVVFWSIFMGRQSKRLIHTVQDNLQLGTNKRIRVLYVNTDNFFASLGEK